MAREPETETTSPTEDQALVAKGVSNRRAILSALAGAPVILTLSSSLALAESGVSMCYVPRPPNTPPPDPEDCPAPPPGT